jgi:hypothetical protein
MINYLRARHVGDVDAIDGECVVSSEVCVGKAVVLAGRGISR